MVNTIHRREEHWWEQQNNSVLDIHSCPTRPQRVGTPASSIPARASAYPSGVFKLRSGYPRMSIEQAQDADITDIPTISPPTLWQHESPDYQAESSLSSLSLVVSEIPTVVYPDRSVIGEQDTLPPDKHLQNSEGLILHPLDRVRWWLLYPGRIEFILWVGGTLLLLGVTFLLVLVTVLSLGWFSIGRSGEPQSFSGANRIISNIEITPLDNGPLVTGTLIYLRGQGFSAYGRVNFTHDTHLSCQPDAMQADGKGEFIVAIMLGNGPGWEPGHHQIVVSDVVSKRSLSFTFMLMPSLSEQHVSATASPDVTATVAPVENQGNVPPPVVQTPLPTAPPPVVSPTALPTQVPPTPTPLPTVGSTPTAGATATLLTPTASVAPISHVTGDQLFTLKSTEDIPFGGWLWLVIVSYSIAMIMLGIVGLLHRRNRKNAR